MLVQLGVPVLIKLRCFHAKKSMALADRWSKSAWNKATPPFSRARVAGGCAGHNGLLLILYEANDREIRGTPPHCWKTQPILKTWYPGHGLFL